RAISSLEGGALRPLPFIQGKMPRFGAESPRPTFEAASGRTKGAGDDRGADQLVRRGPADRRARGPFPPLADLLEVPPSGPAQFRAVRAEGVRLSARQGVLHP